MIRVDLPTRVYDHHFRLDPVIRTLLDTDFYKLLMRQVIEAKFSDLPVEFGIINRSTSVKIGLEIDEAELRAQLNHARALRFDKRELIWLAGNTFFGRLQMFTPEFIASLAAFRLPDYELKRRDGQYELAFGGNWADSSMWEIPALAILNELRARAAMKALGRFELDILYARAKTKLWAKIERLRTLKQEGPLMISDFGTRRRHGYLWQRWCCEALKEGLGDSFIGTSNVHLAMELGVEAIGTNAHELPMVYAALAADDPRALRNSRYKVLDEWAEVYDGNLLIMLPDTYGTTNFLAEAPDRFAAWTGARPNSKPPLEGGEELIDWWRRRGQNPRDKLLVLSDGMDIDAIETSFRAFKDRVRVSFGWGTNLTNDFRGCDPRGRSALDPISLVCKVTSAGGRPAVKLSDNPAKATGLRTEIERYLTVFGEQGMKASEVRV